MPDTIAMLERVLECETDPDRRARAYAALTLARLLAPEWTHIRPVRDAKRRTIGHATVSVPAGDVCGSRSELEVRLTVLLTDLSSPDGLV